MHKGQMKKLFVKKKHSKRYLTQNCHKLNPSYGIWLQFSRFSSFILRAIYFLELN